jgi:hypothetical protein
VPWRRCGRSGPCVLNVADEIANEFNLIGVAVHDFHVNESIFDLHQQFQTIKPVSTEIVTEVRFIRDTSDIDAKMLGNDRADLGDFEAFTSGYRLSEAQDIEGHDEPPDSLSGYIRSSNPPHNVAVLKNPKGTSNNTRFGDFCLG